MEFSLSRHFYAKNLNKHNCICSKVELSNTLIRYKSIQGASVASSDWKHYNTWILAAYWLFQRLQKLKITAPRCHCFYSLCWRSIRGPLFVLRGRTRLRSLVEGKQSKMDSCHRVAKLGKNPSESSCGAQPEHNTHSMMQYSDLNPRPRLRHLSTT